MEARQTNNRVGVSGIGALRQCARKSVRRRGGVAKAAAAAPAEKEESTRRKRGPEEACAVCQDSASGWHYGAPACDCCKEFFERTVRGRHIYDCHFSRECDLRLQRRNHCQGCRWDRCLEVGMDTAAVCKTHQQQHPHHHETDELLVDLATLQAAAAAAPAMPPHSSLPSPTDTDAESGSGSGSSGGGVGGSENDATALLLRRLDDDVNAKRFGSGGADAPISVRLVRDTLTPLPAPESLASRLADLERACLVSLFRWNKRRFNEETPTAGGSFGAAAANWTHIMLASAARHLLLAGEASPSSSSSTLAGRLKWLLNSCLGGGRAFDFEPLIDSQLDCLLARIGDLCSHLLASVLEHRCDVISDVILMLGDETMEELTARLTRHQSDMLPAVHELATAVDQFRLARPEHRALTLAALTAGNPPAAIASATAKEDATTSSFDEDASVATSMCLATNDESVRIPILYGL